MDSFDVVFGTPGSHYHDAVNTILDSPQPMLHSALLLLATLVVLAAVAAAWPAAHLNHDIMWMVAPQDAERSRIRRLILPTDAIELSRPVPPTGRSRLPSLSGGFGTSARHSQHSWTFDPKAAAAQDCTPLLVFVNPGSGGRQGRATLLALRSLLSPLRVVGLDLGTADEALQSFRTVGRFRVLVCGGDGTVGWVLSLLDSLHLEYTPPVAVLPLGTGNDLARALGWGGGSSSRDVAGVLEDVERAQVSLLDRWHVTAAAARLPARLTSGITSPSRVRTPPARAMQNYLGVGVDARVALEWHTRRQHSPHLFSSRITNKLRYAREGAKQIFNSESSSLCEQLRLEADGVRLELPPGTEGVIVLNIGSYGGGSDLWGSDAAYDETQLLQPHSPQQAWKRRGPDGAIAGEWNPADLIASCEASRSAAAAGREATHRRSFSSDGGTDGRRTGDGSVHGGGWAHRGASAADGTSSSFVTPSMDDGLLEVVAVHGVLQLGLAQMSLAGATRICQCRTLTITSHVRLPLQVDGEPFELEPLFAPRTPLSLTVRHKGQAVMLCRSRVRTEGVTLEALDWAVQSNVISVEQHQAVLREVARRTGTMQRSVMSRNNSSQRPLTQLSAPRSFGYAGFGGHATVPSQQLSKKDDVSSFVYREY